MAIVVATVMIEPRMIGTMTPKKSWRSLAPSSRAASITSLGTPLMAADRTTMANPVWSQIMITISDEVDREGRGAGIGCAAEAVQIAFSEAVLRLAGWLPGVDEAPDDGRADEGDRERQ